MTIAGDYSGEYCLRTERGIEMFTDTILLVQNPWDEKYMGFGAEKEDGTVMTLLLNPGSASLQGVWRLLNDQSREIQRGDVTLFMTDRGYAGISSDEKGVTGVWSLAITKAQA